MKKYSVSAIIPTQNKRPQMLAEAIASIKAQTVPVKEIIVVDFEDDAFGNTARRLNYGVKKSTGTHYFFMGDDDQLMPQFVEKIMAAFDDETDIVTTGFYVFGDEEGSHLPGRFPLCSTIVSRAIYDKTQGYDDTIPIGCDADFYFQCFEAGARWKKLTGDFLYKSRVHPLQHSKTGDWGNYNQIIKAKYQGRY